jgi:hypothetical protein
MKSAAATSLFVAAILMASGTAQAEIYKYVDPVTGAVEYTNQPKKGAVRTNMGDTLSEIPTGNTGNTGNKAAKKTSGSTVNVSTSGNLNSGTAAASVDAGTQKTREQQFQQRQAAAAGRRRLRHTQIH